MSFMYNIDTHFELFMLKCELELELELEELADVRAVKLRNSSDD